MNTCKMDKISNITKIEYVLYIVLSDFNPKESSDGLVSSNLNLFRKDSNNLIFSILKMSYGFKAICIPLISFFNFVRNISFCNK